MLLKEVLTRGHTLAAENMPQNMTLPLTNVKDFLIHFKRSLYSVLPRRYW